MSDENKTPESTEPKAPGEEITDPNVTGPQTPDDLEWGTVPATDPATGDDVAIATATGAATHVPVTEPAGEVTAHPHLGLSDRDYLAGLHRQLDIHKLDKRQQAAIQKEIDAVEGRLATTTPEETR